MDQLVIERNYTNYYILDYKDVPFNDFHIMYHLNGLIILTFAPSHFLINSDKNISIKYKITASSATTRKKSGSSQVKIGSKICTVTYIDEQNNSKSLDVISMVKGTLFETNAKIEEDPSLLKLKPESDGYLAIIDPRRSEIDIQQYFSTLISEKDYQEKRKKH